MSEWCNPDNPKFPETANLVKLRQLGVSLNWLLDGGSASEGAGEWPPERIAMLSQELDAYCAGLLANRLGEKTRTNGFSGKYAVLATARVANAARGDFLSYLTSHLKRLVDRTCNELLPLSLFDEMKKWKRRAVRAELKRERKKESTRTQRRI